MNTWSIDPITDSLVDSTSCFSRLYLLSTSVIIYRFFTNNFFHLFTFQSSAQSFRLCFGRITYYVLKTYNKLKTFKQTFTNQLLIVCIKSMAFYVWLLKPLFDVKAECTKKETNNDGRNWVYKHIGHSNLLIKYSL